MPFRLALDYVKTVTVEEYRGEARVDIREYYIDSKTGQKVPGRRGVSLTEHLWRKLIAAAGDIDKALEEMSAPVKEDENAPVNEDKSAPVQEDKNAPIKEEGSTENVLQDFKDVSIGDACLET